MASCLLIGSARAQEADVPFDASRFADLPAEQVALLRQYYDAYIQLKRFYQNVAMTGKQSEYRIPKASDDLPIPSTATNVELSFLADFQYWSREGRHYRLDGTVFDVKDGETPIRAQTGIIGPEESFVLGRDLHTGKHFLKAHGKNRDEYIGMLNSYVFPIAPFAKDVQPLEYVIFHPDSKWSVVSVTSDNGNDKEVVITGMVGTADFGVTSKIHLWPSARWVVKRIERDSRGSRNRSTGKVFPDSASHDIQENEYDGDINGFPLLKSVTCETWSVPKDDSEPALRYRRITEIQSITAEPTDLKVFDVEQLVPKLDRIGVKRSPAQFRWILVINGIVLLLIGIFLSWRAKSRRELKPNAD